MIQPPIPILRAPLTHIDVGKGLYWYLVMWVIDHHPSIMKGTKSRITFL